MYKMMNFIESFSSRHMACFKYIYPPNILFTDYTRKSVMHVFLINIYVVSEDRSLFRQPKVKEDMAAPSLLHTSRERPGLHSLTLCALLCSESRFPLVHL